MNKSAIILATYNGEKYLPDQLESILKQTYPMVEVYIRDDCSCDGTMAIIESYIKKFEDKNIKLKIIENGGKTLGYPECFYEILRKSDPSDYYFFCDQDDVWHKDKVKIVVERLNKEKSDLPLLCFSAFEYCDAGLSTIKQSRLITKTITYASVIYDQMDALGFSIAINNTTKQLVLSNLPDTTWRKDWWFLMTAASMGKVIYEPRLLAKYRRHEKAVTYTTTTNRFAQKLHHRIKEFILRDSFSLVNQSLAEFREKFKNRLSPKHVEMLDIFIGDSFREKLKSIFYPERLRLKILDELTLRLVFLLKR